MKDKFLVTYGFHPGEEYSHQIGRNLEKNPPKNCDVIYFRPSSIKHNHTDLSWPNQVKRSYVGRQELKKHVLDIYKKLPFIIEIHDTENYFVDFQVDYDITYPYENEKLRVVLDEYKKLLPSKSILLSEGPQRYQTSYRSATLDFLPVHFYKESGNFRSLTVKHGEEFARHFIDFLYKNNERF